MATKQLQTEKLVPILTGVVVLLAFGFGVLWQKVSDLQTSGLSAPSTNTGTVQQGANNAPAQPASGKLSENEAANIDPVSPEDHIIGNADAKVVLIEYSDLECPYCSTYHKSAQEALEAYGDDVAWVYRHFPLESIHPRARGAAIGSECVAELGGNTAFWKFIDEIFANQNASLNDLSKVAQNAGVNVSAFETCLESEKYAGEVDSDFQSGTKAGVTGTPGNYVLNSKGEAWLVPGAVPFDENSAGYQPGRPTLKQYIDEALSS